MIQVKKFYGHNELRNYSYLIWDDQHGKCWVVDPYDAHPMVNYIKKNSLLLEGILNTHQHFDHIRGNEELMQNFSCPVKKLSQGETIKLDDRYDLDTLDSPGHTMDHQVFIFKEQKKPIALFSGDTLFNAGVGNCKNGGKVEVLFDTVERLKSLLPPETILYPGHDYIEKNLLFAKSLEPENMSIDEELKRARFYDPENRAPLTLGEELAYNPFFRLHSAEIQENVFPARNSVEDEEGFKRDLFKQIRSLRDKW